MDEFEFFYETEILEHHLDSFGHVNNAVYLELFEQARWDFITRGGFGLKEIHQKKIGPVIIEVTVKFKKELKLRERIKIHTKIQNQVHHKIFEFHQQIVNSSGDVATEAHFKAALFDLGARKMMPPTPEWLEALRRA